MEQTALGRWGGIMAGAGLPATGSVIGGALGIALTNALTARGITAKSTEAREDRENKTARAERAIPLP